MLEGLGSGWVELGTLLPFSLTDQDLEPLFKALDLPDSLEPLRWGSVILTGSFYAGLRDKFRELMPEAANEVSWDSIPKIQISWTRS